MHRVIVHKSIIKVVCAEAWCINMSWLCLGIRPLRVLCTEARCIYISCLCVESKIMACPGVAFAMLAFVVVVAGHHVDLHGRGRVHGLEGEVPLCQDVGPDSFL